jgi:hypothetical protein
MVAAVDQHIADAGYAHFAEGDFWRGGGDAGRAIGSSGTNKDFPKKISTIYLTVV